MLDEMGSRWIPWNRQKPRAFLQAFESCSFTPQWPGTQLQGAPERGKISTICFGKHSSGEVFYDILWIYWYIYWATPMEPNFLRLGIDATQQGTKELSQAISSGELWDVYYNCFLEVKSAWGQDSALYVWQTRCFTKKRRWGSNSDHLSLGILSRAPRRYLPVIFMCIISIYWSII